MLPRVEQKDKQLLANKWQTTITTQGMEYFSTKLNAPYLGGLGWGSGGGEEFKMCEVKN